MSNDSMRLRKRAEYYLYLSAKYLLNIGVVFLSVVQRSKKGTLPPIENAILLESATNLTCRIKKQELKCEDVVNAYIERIGQVQPLINAVIDCHFEDTLEAAKEIDRKLRNGSSEDKEALLDLPLLGVPFTCKDSISMKGWNQTSGSVYRKGVKAEKDASVIQYMKNAGALPLAVTNIPEFVMFWDTDNKVYGRTNNPYDLARIAGGSSGGEAALIASAGSLIGVGSDLGGSIRMPSHCCGIYGHRPTSAIIPTDGMFPEVSTSLEPHAAFGPLCRYATDLPVMLKAMAGNKAAKFKLDEPVNLGDLKILYCEDDGGNPLVTNVNPAIKEAMKKATDYLYEHHQVVAQKITFRRLFYSFHIFGAVVKSKDERKLSDIVAVGKGPISPIWELLKWCFCLSQHTLAIIMACIGELLPAARPNSIQNQKCVFIAQLLRQEMMDAIGPNGVLLYPTLPEPAVKHKTTILKMFDFGYSGVFNALGFPSTHCTMGLTKDGLPVGFQIVTLPHSDRLPIALAIELEKAFGGWVPPEKSKTPA